MIEADPRPKGKAVLYCRSTVVKPWGRSPETQWSNLGQFIFHLSTELQQQLHGLFIVLTFRISIRDR